MKRRVASTLLHEARQMLPPTVFFFVCFNLLVLTVALLSDDHQVSVISHSAATIGALLVGKAVLLADLLPVVDRHRHRPLIYNTLWKAFLYFSVAMILRLAERLVAAATGQYGLAAHLENEASGIDWAHFWAIQLWLAVLFLIFTAFREAVREIGPARVRGMFFTTAPAPPP